MLSTILAIGGKPGLYKLVSRGNNMLIVESLVDGKRMPAYARDKVNALGDICMFTMDEDMPLSDVLTAACKHFNGAVCPIDIKKADNGTMHNLFAEIVPNYDRDRVYPSDIRRLFSWYNILIGAGINSFEKKEETEAAKIEEKPAEKKIEKKPKQVKTQKSAAAKTKTGVGTKKG